ncbi:MAG TPA: M1 family aminopeptidase [Phycisphaerales bacterium]|nr:M1 family aminopeptidase [Phycisphaerales bacterium]
MARAFALMCVAGIACGLAPSAALAQSIAQLEHISEHTGVHHHCNSPTCGKANALRLRMEMGEIVTDADEGPAGSFTRREAFTDTDLISVDLDIEVTPQPNPFIAGTNEMVVRSNVNGLTQFTFMLRRQYTISSITVNGVSVAVPALPATNSYARTVTLNRAYNAGEQFTLRIAYSGVPANVGLGSINFTTQANVPVMASLSEPYYAATWWPVKDGDVFQPGNNIDKSIGRISITAPDNLKSVSNGLLESTDVPAAGKRRYRWRTNYPTATYLYAFGTTNYNQWTVPYNYPLPGGGTGTMPVEFSIYPQSDTPQNRAAWEQCVQMLATFRPLFGEYPFINEKYGIYQFPFGGGMEHQTYSGQGGFGASLSAHELAHQWWGNAITCKTWNDIWLNEGLASYSETLWAEFQPGSTGAAARNAAINARRPSTTDDSVYVYDASNVNRIFSGTFTYNKGGWAMHMLRGILGDAAFFQGLKDYRAQFEGSAATTNDFRDALEASSGVELNPYFDAFVYGIGAPVYNAGFQNTTISGQNYVRVSLRQSQPTNYGASGVFAMPVQLGLTTASGSNIVTVQNTARTQHFLLPTSAPVTGLAIDPENWILTDGKNTEAYVNGPSKIVAVAPAAGSSLAQSASNTALALTFSENINTSAAAFTLTGPSGSVATTFGLMGNVATITSAAPLAPGAYTLTVSSAAVTTLAAGISLDGEFTTALPTGDGLPGGNAVFAFTIIGAPCTDIDFNNNGVFPEDQDVIDFFNVLAGGTC